MHRKLKLYARTHVHPWNQPPEVALCSGPDVVKVNGDVGVPVSPADLVVESESVKELVHDGTVACQTGRR